MTEQHIDYQKIEMGIEIPPHLSHPLSVLKRIYKIDDAGVVLAVLDFAASVIQTGMLPGKSDLSTELQSTFSRQDEIRDRLRVLCAASESAVLRARATLNCAQNKAAIGAMRKDTNE